MFTDAATATPWRDAALFIRAYPWLQFRKFRIERRETVR